MISLFRDKRQERRARQVHARLRAAGSPAIPDVVRGVVVFLDGQSRPHSLKPIARAIAGEVDGIGAVDDRIEGLPGPRGMLTKGRDDNPSNLNQEGDCDADPEPEVE